MTIKIHLESWKTMKPPWKTMETNQKPWKTMNKQKRHRHFSSVTLGHNWPFRCLDKVGHATFGQDNVAKLVIVMSVNIMLVRIMLVLKYWSGWNWQSWSWPRCGRKEGKSGVALLPFCCFCFSFCCLLEHFCRFCILAQLHHLDLVQPSWAGTTLA